MDTEGWVWIVLGALLLGAVLLLWPAPSPSHMNEPVSVPTLVEWYKQHPDRTPPPEIVTQTRQPTGDPSTVASETIVYPETWKTPSLEQARHASAYGRSMRNFDWYAVLSPWTIDVHGSLTDPGGCGPMVTVQTPLQRIAETAWRGARKHDEPLTDEYLTFNMYSPSHSFNEVNGSNVLNVIVRIPGYSLDSHTGYHAVILQGSLVLQPTYKSSSSIISAQWPEYPAYIVLLYYRFDVRMLDPNASFLLKVIPPTEEEITFSVDVARLGSGEIR